MFALLIRMLLVLRSVFEARTSREAEILVLRQQLLVLSRKARKRARLRNLDRLVLVWMCRLFPSLLDAIIVVKPETLLRWHRRGVLAVISGSPPLWGSRLLVVCIINAFGCKFDYGQVNVTFFCEHSAPQL